MHVFYKFYENKIFRIFFFSYFQLLASYKSIINSKKGDIVYLNTFHPFLPAIFCNLTNRRVIFHIHESFPRPNLLQLFLFKIVELTSSEIICVSKCVSNQFTNVSHKVNIVYNSLSYDFLKNSLKKNSIIVSPKNILMVSTLKEYKGIFMFCKVAASLPCYNFTLIISENEYKIQKYFLNFLGVKNLHILPLQTNLHKFYLESDLILNLTDYTQVIETFGMTILEAMSYGVPSIVPPNSGVTELVINNYNGQIVDTLSQEDIATSIKYILNPNNYNKFSTNTINRFSSFSSTKFQERIKQILLS